MLTFLPIGTLDRNRYRASLAASFPTRNCEYNYANLFAWRKALSTVYAPFEDGYLIRMSWHGETFFFSPTVSDRYFDAAVNAAFDASGDDPLIFTGVPKDRAEALVKRFPEAVSTPDRDNFDYLYECGKLTTFSGKHLHAKKNHLNKFHALYGDTAEYRPIQTDADLDACAVMSEQWYAINASGLADEEFRDEKQSTGELLTHFFSLSLVGGMLFVSGALCAFTLASANFDGADTLDVHTEKAFYDVDGAYPAICSAFLTHEGGAFAYVNREDDTGDEGLRQSKQSYHPVELLEKYTVRMPRRA